VEIERVNLLDESAFVTSGGLWTGKRGPFVSAIVIRNTNFTASGRVDYSNVAVLEVEEKQLASRRLILGDIIIERSGGGPSQPVGRVVFFDRDGGVYSHSNFTSRLRVLDTRRFEPRFVFYFLLYFHDRGQTDHLQRRTTGIRNLDWRAYREAAGVPLFDVDEQRQIAAVLLAVQRAIERQAQLIALTAELKKALMHKLFTEGTGGEPLRQSEIGPVPESWKVEPLGSLFSREPSNGLYLPQSNYGRGTLILRIDDFSNDGDIVTGASNRVNAGEVDRQRFGLAKDDIVLNRVNSLSHLGKTALIGELDEPMLFESNMMRFRVDEKRLRPAFAFRALNSAVSKSQIVGMAKRAVAQSSVNQGDVGRLLIPLPPDVETQDEILTILNALEAKSAVHVRTRASLNNLFRTLLHQLMTAQVRVHDLDLSALEEAAQEPAGAA
jgi:type I restriction enzyme S subunit